MKINAENLKRIALQKQQQMQDAHIETAMIVLNNLLPLLSAAAEEGELSYVLLASHIPQLLGSKLSSCGDYFLILNKLSEILSKKPYSFKTNYTKNCTVYAPLVISWE